MISHVEFLDTVGIPSIIGAVEKVPAVRRIVVTQSP